MGRIVSGGTTIAVPTTPTTPTTTDDSSVIDPRKEGLPMFAIWSMQDDQFRHIQCSTYAPDGSQTNNPWAYGLYSSPSSYRGGVMQDKYLGYSGDGQSWYRTSSTISSNSTSYMVGRTQDNTHWPSNLAINIGPTGQFASNIGYNNSSYSYWYYIRFMITQVLPEGVRPRMFLGRDGGTIYRSLQPSNQTNARVQDRFTWYDSEMVAAFPELANRRYNNGYGNCGYNEKTGYFVLFAKTTNGSVDMFKWKLGARISDPKVPFKKTFLEATEFEYRQMDNTENLTGDEGYYRGQITVGDNGYCRWTRMQDSSRMQSNLFHLDSSVASQFITANSPDSTGQNYSAQNNSYSYELGLTTCYGIDQGNYHIGTVYNATWDNKWIIHFNHYYYYGAGCMGFVHSTSDPRVCYTWRNTDSTYTNSPVASGTTGWIFSRDQNSDSNDVYYHNFNLADLETSWDTIKQNIDNSVSNPYGSSYTYTQWNPSSLYQSVTQTNRAGLVPAHGYHSTNYPRLLNVNWWPTKDGRMQFSGDY
jgi:hypothetical protein